MTNEIAAVLIFALWLIDGRRFTLTLAIFYYFILVMAIGSVDMEAKTYYYLATLVDITIIGFICFLSTKYNNSILINSMYCVIILVSMSLSGLTLLDQVNLSFSLQQWHEAFNEYVIYADLTFALLGARFVTNLTLPFGGR